MKLTEKPSLLYWLSGLAVVFSVISIGFNISSSTITSESLVISFVGILATFIVVSNYAQIVQISNEIKEKMDKIDNSISDLNDRSKKWELDNNEMELKLKGQLIAIQHTAAESYRLYAIYTNDKNLIKTSVYYTIKALTLYYLIPKHSDKMIDALLDDIRFKLNEYKWKTTAKEEISCDEAIKMVEGFPYSTQKLFILERLNQYNGMSKSAC